MFKKRADSGKMAKLVLSGFNIDTVVNILLNPVYIWSGILFLLYILPVLLARSLLVLSVVLSAGLYANTLYKRRGAWDKLGPQDLALVTGGSNGLGLAIVRQLLSNGVKVINIDIEPTPNDLNNRVLTFYCDLSNETRLFEVLNTIQSEIGTPTIIINNAAIRQNERFENLPYEKIKKIIQTNTLAPISIIKHFIKKQTKRLYIVNVSSILGLVSPSNLSIYSLTKSSIISLHDTLTHEFSSNVNIRFLLVTPGQLNTRMFEDVQPPKTFLAPVLDSFELSKQIVKKIENGERGCLLGPFYTYFIPFLRLMPFSLVEFARWLSEVDVSVKQNTDNTSSK